MENHIDEKDASTAVCSHLIIFYYLVMFLFGIRFVMGHEGEDLSTLVLYKKLSSNTIPSFIWVLIRVEQYSILVSLVSSCTVGLHKDGTGAQRLRIYALANKKFVLALYSCHSFEWWGAELKAFISLCASYAMHVLSLFSMDSFLVLISLGWGGDLIVVLKSNVIYLQFPSIVWIFHFCNVLWYVRYIVDETI